MRCKKMIGLILVSSMMVSMLSGCNLNEESDEGKAKMSALQQQATEAKSKADKLQGELDKYKQLLIAYGITSDISEDDLDTYTVLSNGDIDAYKSFNDHILLKKKLDKSYKILNFSTTIIINILLLFIIDIVQTNKINMIDKLSVYSNSNLMVLLQLTSAVFVSWILLTLLMSAHNKLKKYDKKELVPMPEIIFEDI